MPQSTVTGRTRVGPRAILPRQRYEYREKDRRRMAATTNYPTLRLRQGRDYAVQAGHPWLFSGAFEQLPADLPAGSVADVVANSGEWVARGHLNAKNSLAFRVLTRDAEEAIDEDFYVRRIKRAHAAAGAACHRPERLSRDQCRGRLSAGPDRGSLRPLAGGAVPHGGRRAPAPDDPRGAAARAGA